jgi:hypothetical protein
MKLLLGPTDLWRFPITGEETWAGVGEQYSSSSYTDSFHPTRRYHHATSTQPDPRLTQSKP